MKYILALNIFMSAINAKAGGPEILLGYIYGREGITLQVLTGGCTTKDDFVVERGYMNYTNTLTFYRRHRDTCLAIFRYGKTLKFTYEELGMDREARFRILNPIDASRRAF